MQETAVAHASQAEGGGRAALRTAGHQLRERRVPVDRQRKCSDSTALVPFASAKAAGLLTRQVSGEHNAKCRALSVARSQVECPSVRIRDRVSDVQS